ncbi:lasso RiPP family leader peptide-containing protein [Streptomyces sp. P1-3]
MTDRESTARPIETEIYEPPMLLEVGEFSEDTLGFGSRYTDVLGEQGWG